MRTLRHFSILFVFVYAAALSSSAACPCTIWSSSAAPAVVDSGDGTNVEVGVRIRSDVAGFITGVRFYKAAANTGTHIGSVWNNNGSLLGSVTFSGETASGWQQATLGTPIAIAPNTTYVVSYSDPNGHYSFDSGYFGSAATDNAPLHALQDGVDGPNGNYALGHSFPTNGYQSSNYWVDVLFTPQNSGSTPTVFSVSPANGSSGAGVTTTVQAVFSQPMTASSINSTTFQLLDSLNNAISGSVTYNANTQTATLTPGGSLHPSTTFNAIIQSGTSGVRDSNNNTMASNFTWTFSTAGVPNGGYTIWSPSTVPSVPDSGDSSSVEVGVRVRADVSGFIAGVRFYKSPANTGTHIGSVWSNTGTLLGNVTFTGESTSGWQEADLSTPVLISPNTTYVVSYSDPSGHYSYDNGYFANTGVNNPPLHAVQDGVNGPNGNFAIGHAFPTNGYQSSNYWIDVAFVPENTTSTPTIFSVSPRNGSSGADVASRLTAVFNQPMNASTINGSTFEVFDSSNNQVTGTVGYDPTSQVATFTPGLEMNANSAYHATIQGGPGGVLDTNGNSMASSVTWSFTSGAAPPAGGPGGPILIISYLENAYTQYLAEMLKTEGFNEYTIADISQITPAFLANYDVAILGDMPLSAAQTSMLDSWVTGGGNLIAMHPDPQLAGLLGLSPLSSILSNAYLQVQTASGPGVGIVGQTIQFHGAADLYSLNGASAVATLYSNATTATSSPAVSLITVGSGQAAAFTYDLSKSVIYTRQGNPAWSGEARDGQTGPMRSDDLFFGAASFDLQPDWVDLNKVAIPQADEQQRLLANLIVEMNAAKKPLPRFWYFPSGFKAVVVMTGDDHGTGSGGPGSATAQRFNDFINASAPGCSVPDWQCVRSTSYLFPANRATNPMTNSQAMSFVSQGFEIGMHADNSCSDWTTAQLDSTYSAYLSSFAAQFPGLPAPRTHRMHCVSWSDYDSQPQVELKYGIRLDTDYYYWPPTWINDVPGLFTGSGMPMRFVDRSGNIIDAYQAVSQMTDESGQTYPKNINTLLGNAVGPNGFYGAFTANMHNDISGTGPPAWNYPGPGANQIVSAAQANGVPVVSAVQMLTWLDGHGSSTFSSISWNGNALSFIVSQASGARNLQAMLPATVPGGSLSSLTFNGTSMGFTLQTIKGIQYAFFAANTGSYQATYGGAVSVSLASVSTNPTSVVGGQASTGTVTLTGAAPANGATVSLSSDNAAAQVPNPPSVTVPSGQSSATFTITTSTVSSSTVANISGTYGVTRSGQLTVTAAAPSLSSVSLNPTSVTGGNSSIATVTLTGPAPTNGAIVSLSSDNGAAQVPNPPNVTVPVGQTSTTFTVTTTSVSSTVTANISGIYGTTKSGQLTITPAGPAVSSITLNPTGVTGGTSSTGTVTLTAAAPINGVNVTLSSGNTAVAQVPASVTVPSGATGATFTVTTTPVAANTQVGVSATNGASATATLTVNAPTLSALTANPITVTGGANATGTVTLNGRAPTGGAVVTLQSSNSAAAQVSATVTVSAGSTTSNFTITTTPVSTNTSVTISGTFGVTRTATVTVNAAALSSVTANPSSVTGGSNSTGTVILTGLAPASGATVTLSSSNTNAAQVPVSVLVPSGASRATFQMTTKAVSSSVSVTITGNYRGSHTTTLNVNSPTLRSLTLNPSSVVGGSSSIGTVTLNGPAPPGGASVSLNSNKPLRAQVPLLGVTIPSGSTSATFTVTTSPVHGTSANISASYNHSSASATLTIR